MYTLRHIPAKDRKTLLKEMITKSMNGNLNTEGQNKSKFKFLTTNSETRSSGKPSYLYKPPKEQARAIFMARTRMIKVKTNYKNMHPNTICRGCGQTEETQQKCTRGIHFNPHTGQPKDTNQPSVLQWPNNYQINSQQTNNPIKNHKRMGTSVACYHDGAWRPGAPGNTHVKRKKKKVYVGSSHYVGDSIESGCRGCRLSILTDSTQGGRRTVPEPAAPVESIVDLHTRPSRMLADQEVLRHLHPFPSPPLPKYPAGHAHHQKHTLLSHWLTTLASGLQGIPTMGAVLFLKTINPMKWESRTPLSEGPRPPLEHRRLGTEMSGWSWGGAEMTGRRLEGAEMTGIRPG